MREKFLLVQVWAGRIYSYHFLVSFFYLVFICMHALPFSCDSAPPIIRCFLLWHNFRDNLTYIHILQARS